MISLKCRNCSGEMSVDLKGELACPYCGSKEHLSDRDLTNYKNFRYNMLNYLRAAADRKADESDDRFIWDFHDTAVFHSSKGTKINIDYLFYSEDDGIRMYTAKESVICVFPENKKHRLTAMLDGLNRLEYPSAALKNLSRCFPVIKTLIDLDDGGVIAAISKPENAFPLYAYGSVIPEHAAWIVSRLENICCVFEYSGITHNGINIDNVFINTRTHEAFLYGGWWKSSAKNGSSDNADLTALRKTADMIMGEYKEQAPDLFRKFIHSAPAVDAYTDFEKWDEVIEKGFGGHKFKKFEN